MGENTKRTLKLIKMPDTLHVCTVKLRPTYEGTCINCNHKPLTGGHRKHTKPTTVKQTPATKQMPQHAIKNANKYQRHVNNRATCSP